MACPAYSVEYIFFDICDDLLENFREGPLHHPYLLHSKYTSRLDTLWESRVGCPGGTRQALLPSERGRCRGRLQWWGASSRDIPVQQTVAPGTIEVVSAELHKKKYCYSFSDKSIIYGTRGTTDMKLIPSPCEFASMIHRIDNVNIICSLRMFLSGNPLKSLRPSDACVSKPSLVQIMACRLDGAKPLSEPMLACCQLDWEDISVKFKSELHHFHSSKCNL